MSAKNFSRKLSDDDFDFGSGVTRDHSDSFTRTQVKRDVTTGEITGWDEFYELVRLNDPSQSTTAGQNNFQAIEKWQEATRNTYIPLRTDQI